MKTERFRKPRYLGDPVNAVRIFNDKEVDELMLLDIGRPADQDGPRLGLIERVASECFMPLAYGGHIRDEQDAANLFSLGVEKLVLRTAAARDPGVISRLATVAGSQAIAVAVDVKSSRLRGARLVAPGTARHGDADWLGFLRRAVDLGAGEIVLTSVDREGTMQGLDLELIAAASAQIETPLVAHGGVGSIQHIVDGLQAGATAVAVGSFCVYNGPRKAVLMSYPPRTDIERFEEMARAHQA